MKILSTLILLLVLLGVTGAVVFFATRHRTSLNLGFVDVVKNPDYWKELSRNNAEVDAAAGQAKGWSDQQVASAVTHFILEEKTSRDAEGQVQILHTLGARTWPTVLKLLSDPTLYQRLVIPTGENIVPEAPFNRACDVLGDAPPEAAVNALSPFLNDPSTGIRQTAAIAIAKTGASSMVPLVQKALVDPDTSVQTYALMGLEFTVDRNGMTGATQQELFPSVLALIQKGTYEDSAARILFHLDQEKAKAFFLSEKSFNADSPSLYSVLATLAGANVPVPRDRLLSLIGALEIREMKYPTTYALGSALRLLGEQGNQSDREFLRQRTSNPQEEVARGASDGLLSSYGLQGFEQKMADKEDKSGFDSLSQEQKFYCTVTECDGEIDNGGLAQYFVNSSGDDWPLALAGFEAMGMKGRLAILKEAVALFGPEGPSTHRETRQEQLAQLYRKNKAAFDALDDRYYKVPEVVDVMTGRYVLEHPNSFR